jgi:hypothetical protein
LADFNYGVNTEEMKLPIIVTYYTIATVIRRITSMASDSKLQKQKTKELQY